MNEGAVTLGDRVVVVTGAGRGLGEGIVEALLDAGARVVVSDLREEDVVAVAQRLDPAGERTLALALDVTDDDAIAVAVAHTVQRFSRLDGWVNNAGVVKLGPALESDRAAWDFELGVNVAGLFSCCRATAAQMVAQGGGGAIVNIASNAGKVGYPNMAAYNASKAAVINLTRSLSGEWAQHGINVNCVCPGGVDTPMLAGVAEWLAERTGQDAAELLAGMGAAQLGRRIRPVEVGRVVAFLLSDEATIIRGQAINVDGGDTPY